MTFSKVSSQAATSRIKLNLAMECLSLMMRIGQNHVPLSAVGSAEKEELLSNF